MNNSIGYKVLCYPQEKQFALALLASFLCQARPLLSPSPPRPQDPRECCSPSHGESLCSWRAVPSLTGP